MNETFIVTLPSDASILNHPDNVMANYTTEINPTIRFADNWDVALREITIPRIENKETIDLPDKLGKIELIKFVIGNRAPATTSSALGFLAKADIVNNDLIEYLNSTISFLAMNNDQLNITIKKHVDNFKYFYTIDLPHNYSIKFIGDIADMLGFKSDKEIFNNTKSTIMELPYISTLFVYCDIIKYSHVGDSSKQLLNTVAVPHIDEIQNIKFDIPDFIPLSRNVIESIKITIKDSMNNLVSFRSGTSKVITKLVFRKKYGF